MYKKRHTKYTHVYMGIHSVLSLKTYIVYKKIILNFEKYYIQNISIYKIYIYSFEIKNYSFRVKTFIQPYITYTQLIYTTHIYIYILTYIEQMHIYIHTYI